MSNIVNKIKDAVSGHKDHADHTAGPHNTDTGNRVDPRVDSTTGTTGTTGSGFGSSNYDDYTSTGTHTSHGVHGSTNAGPHNSNVANKIDPRVDSDRDGRAAYGGAGGYDSTTGGQYGSNTGYGSNTTASPHSSNVANKLDPRVDNQTGQYSSTGSGYQSGATGTGYGSTHPGPHDSSLANRADPRVDEYGNQTTSTHGTHGAHGTHNTGAYASENTGSYGNTTNYGENPESTNHGPHKSNLLNKLDPRVDSDNSRTGGNSGYAHKDRHDAAQVPPSEFKQHGAGSDEIPLHMRGAHGAAGRPM